MEKILIDLENLPSIFHIDLDEKFRQFLFKMAKNGGTWTSLAKRIGYSNVRLRCLKRGYRTIHNRQEKNLLSISLLKELSEISHVPLQDIKQHIIMVRVGRGKCCPLKLPICESPELASIIAHSLGDGHLENNIFTYFNEREELIKLLIRDVKKVFGHIEPNLYYNESNEINAVYGVVVACILSLVGGVKFNKILQDYDVPQWIKNGSREIKASFIRGLFDDEASVDSKQRGVAFQMSSNKNFILSMLDILKDFGIKSKLRKAGKYVDKNNNEKIMYGFGIGKLENLLKFKEIGFNHVEKQKMLLNAIESFQHVHYLYEDIEERIVNLLKKEPLTVRYLMKEFSRSNECIRIHLNSLYKKNLVIKVNINKYPSTWKAR